MPGKLLFTASSYEHIEKFHVPYLLKLRERGWVTHVAGAGMPSKVSFSDRSFNLAFNKHERLMENIRTVAFLRKLMRQEQYDLIITHTTLGAFITRLAVLGIRQRPRVIYVCHGYLFSDDMPWYKNLILRTAERVTAGVTDLLLTMNRYDYRAAVRARYGHRIEEIPGIGVDFKTLAGRNPKDRELLRKRYAVSDTDTVLIYAAEFSGRKSQEVLILAMAFLPQDIILVLPGNGKMLDKCIELARGLDRRIIFPGFVTDISAWYSMADIAVSSSRSEGLPFNIMEAMYLGLPVVASAVKGHVDLIEHSKTGLLFPYGDSRQCAAQILKLVRDPHLQNKLSANAKNSLGQYNLDEVLPQIMAYYCASTKRV